MKQLFKWAASAFVALSLAACGGGGGSPGVVAGSQGLATDAPSGLIILVGTIRDFTITGGKAPYTAMSNNELVAVTGVSGNTVAIGTVGVGTATVTVRDSVGATAQIALTSAVAHPFGTSAPNAVTLQVGSTQSYTVSGGVPGYGASSSNVGVVTARMVNGSTLQLTGVAAGTATVTVSDGIGDTVNISVTVVAVNNLDLFTTAPPSITMAVGDAQSFTIGGGSGSYLLSSNNTLVARVPSTSTGELSIAAVGVGSATIQITDTLHSKTVNVGVTVVSNAATLSTTAPSTVTIAASTTQTYSISGGSGAYSVVNTNPFNVQASVSGSSSGGGTLTLTGLLVGSSTVTVRDASGSQVVLTVNVIAPGSTIALLPEALTVSESAAASFEVDLQIFGGTPPYRAFTSNLSITNPPVVTGTTMKVTVTNGTNACVTADTPVILTVMDSQGATATSTLTIKEVNAACP